MNSCDLIGRLTADPELRTTPQGTPVASFTLAVDRENAKDKTDFLRVVAWRGTAEFVAKHLRKGERVGIHGNLQSRTYTDRDTGKTVTVYEIMAEKVYFADGRRPTYQAGSAAAEAIANGDFEPVDDEEDLPFA